MSTVGQAINFVLLVCILVLLARFILDWVQLLARSWRPQGAVAVLCEGIYTVTDPPLRLLRRIIPPLRLGGVQFDLAFLILIIAVQILINVALAL